MRLDVSFDVERLPGLAARGGDVRRQRETPEDDPGETESRFLGGMPGQGDWVYRKRHPKP
jgi:hypothetical protein